MARRAAPSSTASAPQPGAAPAAAATAADRNEGTQAIRRAAGLLRAIAQAGVGGQSLAAIARAQGLPRSTAHRILHGLEDEGLLERDAASGQFRVGPLIHELSLTSTTSAADIARWAHVVEVVAQRTGVTAYLMRRSGIEAVCLVKADGDSMLRFVPVEVGQRRLLGVGAGATALLAALEPARTEEVIAAVAPGLARHPRLTPEVLRAAVRLVRRGGYAISQGTAIDDGFGIGCAIPDDSGTPRLALSIAAHASSVTESRIALWKKVLAEEMAAALQAAG